LSILFVTNDLVFPSRVFGSAGRLSTELIVVMSVAKLADELAKTEDVSLVIVDLNTPAIKLVDLVATVRFTGKRPITIVAYGPHVHAERLEAARNAGCDEVLTRGQFSARMDALLASWGRPD
jgi:CheY-like chemotaxis protein